MKSQNQVIRSQRMILIGDAEPKPASILIMNGKIEAVGSYSEPFDETPSTDFGNQLILPGIVDTHAHINEPGRTEWEGFQTATWAAAAGGVTTVIDMPLNSIPATTSAEALRIKGETAESQCSIDYGFWGGVIPGNHSELKSMIHAGVMGFKCFLIDSGVPEFPATDEAVLRKIMPILAAAGLPLIVHAELCTSQTMIATSSPHPPQAPPEREPTHLIHASHAAQTSYATYLSSRPAQWEVAAIRMMIGLSEETGCRVHIVHLSAAGALGDIRQAKARGTPITVETCPHYLTFTAEEIPDGATLFKCAPPIRERENRERLWQGLESGIIDCIVSDHSPCTPILKELKTGDFEKAWGGISGIQFSLPAVWTEMKNRGIPISRLTTWMSKNPALLAGLSKRKGALQPGFDADFIVFDPEAKQVFNSSPGSNSGSGSGLTQIYHRHRPSPYEGHHFYGTVLKTFVRGNLIYDAITPAATNASTPISRFSKIRLGNRLLRA